MTEENLSSLISSVCHLRNAGAHLVHFVQFQRRMLLLLILGYHTLYHSAADLSMILMSLFILEQTQRLVYSESYRLLRPLLEFYLQCLYRVHLVYPLLLFKQQRLSCASVFFLIWIFSFLWLGFLFLMSTNWLMWCSQIWNIHNLITGSSLSLFQVVLNRKYGAFLSTCKEMIR